MALHHHQFSSIFPCDQYQKFEYHPLKSNPQEIRLLKAARNPTTLNSDTTEQGYILSFEMYNVPLQNPPSYIALSYYWGDPTRRNDVLCNGHKVKITDNLLKAIRTVFARIEKHPEVYTTCEEVYPVRGDVFLWADGLCINQDDIQEKNAQVPLMGQIFHTAKRVVGYVGSAPDGDPHASIHAMMLGANLAIFDHNTGVMSDPSPVHQTASCDLSKQLWFSRGWVMQEVVLGREVECVYGDHDRNISWTLDAMAQMLYGLESRVLFNISEADWIVRPRFANQLSALRGFESNNIANVGRWLELRSLHRRRSSGLDIVQVLEQTREMHVSDMRDKIYSVLALLNEEDRNSIRVDYSASTSVESLYSDIARYCVRTGYALRLLELAGTSKSISSLPTWAPDWSTVARYPLYTGLYKCAASTIPLATLPLDERKLILRGAIIDTVISLGSPCSFPHGIANTLVHNMTSDLATNAYMSVVVVIESAYVMGNYLTNISDGYVTKELIDSVIFRTLVLDRNWEHPFSQRAGDQERKAFEAFRLRESEHITYPTRESTRSLAAEHYRLNELSIPFLILALDTLSGRVLCATKEGFLGILPNDARRGDVIAIFFGGNVPFVLRPLENGEYLLVGPCYIHGIMDGELIDLSSGDPRVHSCITQDIVLQ